MAYQSEAQLEDKLIKKLSTLNYTFVKLDDYDALEKNFREQISIFNKDTLGDVPLSDIEFNRLIQGIAHGKSVFQCAKQLRDKFVLDRDDNSRIYLQFMSQNPEENIWQVTNQVTVVGKYKNRYDVTLLCNGLPLVQIELKRSGIDIKEAINQIDRYRIHSYKGLFHFVQVFIVSNSVETRYFSNTDDTRIMKSLTFYWTDEANERINNLDDFSSAFLNQNRLTKLIHRYMVINETDKNLMVMRPYQIFATESILRKALTTDKGGYIFHTTGSGKTLTSFKTAQLLTKENKIKKVFFLVDRSDLDTQTMQEFNRFEDGCVDYTDRTDTLVKQIEDPNKKLIISTIQKMATAIRKPYYQKKILPYRDEKVIFIIDECHRSQFGKMHNDVKKFFTKAQYFGFTGTPRFVENKSQDGRTTSDVFGECLHQYLIKEAIFDKNVLGFNVEYISTYEGQYDENDGTLVEAIDKKEVLESDERVSLVAQHIVDHHNTKTRISGNKYTAIFATSSIPMLMKYYDEFKKIDHNLKIAAVFSFGTNEDLEDKVEHSRDSLQRIMDDYNKMFDTKYTTDTFAAYNADISKRLKVKKIPEIDLLIVVNMYLTGFDSRPLNTLYVDKNLEWHNLLQAFSRTNRVEKETKQFGNIICYRNLKKQTDDALRLFSGGGDVTGVLLKPYEYYVEQFKELAAILHNEAKTPADIDHMQSEEEQAKFVIAFRELSKVLLTLETFTDFTWADIEDSIEQQEYEDFKGRYFTIHDSIVKGRESEKVSILDDIDFSIEIIQTDKINVAYIMNLLKNVDMKDKKQKEKDLAHIFDELDRTDNPELKKKVDLIKAFLNEMMPIIQEDEDVLEKYSEYEDKARTSEIEAFATDKNIEFSFLRGLISEFEFSHILDKDAIRSELKGSFSYKEKKLLVTEIMEFIIENCNKYQL